MAKLRAEDVASLDVKELEAAEYSNEEFDRYYGETPPVGTELNAYVKRMYWTRSSKNDPMLKILTVAAENEGDLEQYNDCPFWLNAALIPGAKFRWGPFFDNFGISIRAVKARKVDVEPTTDQNGAPINSIDGFRPGEDSDEAWCRIITDQEPYNGAMQPRVKEWLPWDDEDEDADDEADDLEAEDEEEDEDEDELEEEEEEAEPAPARGRRGAARSQPQSPAPARGTRSASRAPARPAAAVSAPRGGRAAARSGRSAAPAAAAAPARRGRRAAAKDDIPF
jgi:hypothetical protein